MNDFQEPIVQPVDWVYVATQVACWLTAAATSVTVVGFLWVLL